MKNKLFLAFLLSVVVMPTPSFGKEVSLEIKAQRFFYTPNIVTVDKGDVVNVRLISQDVHHGLFIDGYEVETSAVPGKDGTLTFIADKTGRFSYRCSVTCGDFHAYMIGYLYVTPNNNLLWGIILVSMLGLGSFLFTIAQKEHNPRLKLFGLIPMDWKFELTKYRLVRKLLKSRWFPFILIVANMAVFSVILTAGVMGGFGAGNYTFGVMIVWILWWSLLMMFMVPIVGRFWCMICPFPLIGEWFQRGKLVAVGRRKSWGLNKRLPNRFRNLWPLVILFWVSTWFSGFFTVRPYATFILLGVIILLAIIISLIYGRRAFCISVCPVSGFQGLYSNFSLCEVRSKDPDICKKHIRKTCAIGNEKGYGCPWMELPYEMNRNTYCGLCMECFKTCPYDNMAFNLRPFGADFFSERKRTDDRYGRRSTDEAFKALTMIGIMFSFFLAMQGPFGHIKDMVRATTMSGFATYILESAFIDFLAIPLSLLVFAFLSKKFSGNKEVKLKDVFVNFSYCLVPAGLAVWAAFSLGVIMPNGSYLLHIISDPLAWGWNIFGTANFPWTPFFTGLMPPLQIALVLLGLIFALDFGYKFSLRTYGSVQEAKRGWIPMLVYLVAIHVGFIWLFVG